jgi:hypothetical protein
MIKARSVKVSESRERIWKRSSFINHLSQLKDYNLRGPESAFHSHHVVTCGFQDVLRRSKCLETPPPIYSQASRLREPLLFFLHFFFSSIRFSTINNRRTSNDSTGVARKGNGVKHWVNMRRASSFKEGQMKNRISWELGPIQSNYLL